MAEQERIFAVAIRRDGKLWDGGRGSHYLLRHNLGDAEPSRKNPNDEEGFIVSPSGRFVDRREAHAIAFAAKQISTNRLMEGGDRDLLSSEVEW